MPRYGPVWATEKPLLAGDEGYGWGAGQIPGATVMTGPRPPPGDGAVELGEAPTGGRGGGSAQQEQAASRAKNEPGNGADGNCERRCQRLMGWLPFVIIWTGAAAAGSVWPHKLWGWQMRDHCATDSLGMDLRPWIENALATSAVTGRGALLSAVVTQIAAFVFGFKEWPEWCPHCCPWARGLWRRVKRCLYISDPAPNIGFAAATVAAADSVPALDEMLHQAITSTEVREAARPHFMAFLEQRDQRIAQSHKLDIAAAGRGWLKTLLTGHGATPAPRLAAGWLAITDETTTQSRWDVARCDLGLTWWQGVGVSLTKLLLWHISQPIAYLIIFRGYYCVLSDAQQNFGSVVAAREVLYLATAVAAVCACPVFLLVDLSTVWHKEAAGADATVFDRVTRLAMYILTPQNYVAKVLVCRYQLGTNDEDDYSGSLTEAVICTVRLQKERLLAVYALLGSVVTWVAVGLAAAFAPHGRGSDAVWVPIPWALLGAWVAALLRRWAFNVDASSRRIDSAGALGNCALFGIAAGPAICGWLRTWTTAHSASDHAASRVASWHRFLIGCVVLLSTVACSWLGGLVVGREVQDLNPIKALMGSIALAQLFADFASCFALGMLLADGFHDHDAAAPFALKVGYAVTALGFLLFFGPLGIYTSLNRALTMDQEIRQMQARGRKPNRRKLQSVCAITIGGLVLLVGWLYVMVGGVQLGMGIDVFCNGYTFFLVVGRCNAGSVAS
jgi:hypothetical protein